MTLSRTQWRLLGLTWVGVVTTGLGSLSLWFTTVGLIVTVCGSLLSQRQSRIESKLREVERAIADLDQPEPSDDIERFRRYWANMIDGTQIPVIGDEVKITATDMVAVERAYDRLLAAALELTVGDRTVP